MNDQQANDQQAVLAFLIVFCMILAVMLGVLNLLPFAVLPAILAGICSAIYLTNKEWM